MSIIGKKVPLYLFVIRLLLILTILVSMSGAVNSSSERSVNVLTETDFAEDPGLFATPDKEIIALFLESPLSPDEPNDTGDIGLDIIPYKYDTIFEQTFCWDDDDETAEHFMTLIDNNGTEVITVYANGDCVTERIAEGDYEMHVSHDGKSDRRVVVFIVPEEDRSLLTTAPYEALQNVTSVLNTDKCIGCDLSDVNLYNADLSGVDLRGAVLNNAILVDADLSGADLSGAQLINADLSRANLRGADLSGADLSNAILINADLTDVDLRLTNLDNADLTDAILDNTNITLPGRPTADPTAGVREVVAAAEDECMGGTLDPGDGTKDLLISAPCDVGTGVYQYQNVNIIKDGELNFLDTGGETHFWAKSILVENEGSLIAGEDNDMDAFGANGGTLFIHLYGKDVGDLQGIECKSPVMTPGVPCGITEAAWNMGDTMEVPMPTTGAPFMDYFYKYKNVLEPLIGEMGFSGRKVLAVSYGGTLKLFGKKGSSFSELESSDSGKSWARLDGTVIKGATQLKIDREVDWEVGDRIVVTTTDYLPGHSEVLEIIAPTVDKMTFNFKVLDPYTGDDIPEGLQHDHNGTKYPLDAPDRLGLKITAAETRAAVALLTRSIRIVSASDSLPTDSMELMCKYNCFPPTGTEYYYGGHVMARQGVKELKLQGVEFYQLGQGGRKGRYPVHMHLVRRTPEDTFIKDCSVRDSMTRWYVLHGTQDMTLARNVGYMSIGHGYYLEDGTEIKNKLYSNIGIFARAAIDNIQNPRKVPGILAWTADKAVTTIVPSHSDYAQPTVFWIMNGWNDFEYNMAAGANACGVCYWWLPGQISGPSQEMMWDSYAAQQNTMPRAGITPLKNFKGNYCTTAMTAFNSIKDISPCLGVGGPGIPIMEPITTGNIAPEPKADASMETYYPKVDGAHFPTRCEDGQDCTTVKVCSAGERDNCMVSVIDRFTTAFNWTETNFAAIWLRPQWYLVIHNVISDVQNAGLSFVTGGDYTVSNFIPGQWQLARQNVFIGETQEGNAYASAAGPVNKGTDLECEEIAPNVPVGNYCLLRDEGVSLPLSNFANNQRLFNIYDGPSFEDSNGFFNIQKTFFDNSECNVGQGTCVNTTKSMYGGVPLMPYDKDEKKCFLPHAAIAWKQPNGFYYPAAFHSSNLFFEEGKVDIRHFVIEPLFVQGGKFAFQSDDDRVKEKYCTFALNDPNTGLGGSFGNFSAN